MSDQQSQLTETSEDQLRRQAFNIFEGVKAWLFNAPDADLLQITMVSAIAAAHREANKPFTAEHVDAAKSWVANLQEMIDMSALAMQSFLCVNVENDSGIFELSPAGANAYQKTKEQYAGANPDTPTNV